jgi:hypothetical protein
LGVLTFREGQVQIFRPNNLDEDPTTLTALFHIFGVLFCGMVLFDTAEAVADAAILARERWCRTCVELPPRTLS